ncbi:Na/Pi symporter [Bacillus sp. N9]
MRVSRWHNINRPNFDLQYFHVCFHFYFSWRYFYHFLKRGRWKLIGTILLSIGFIFLGIHLISSSLDPLSKNLYFLEMLVYISKSPLLFALIAMLLTALFHSSAAMIIIGIAFVTTGILSVQTIIPLVIGANVGSTIPVIMTSLATNKEGKKLASFYFLLKRLGPF